MRDTGRGWGYKVPTENVTRETSSGGRMWRKTDGASWSGRGVFCAAQTMHRWHQGDRYLILIRITRGHHGHNDTRRWSLRPHKHHTLHQQLSRELHILQGAPDNLAQYIFKGGSWTGLLRTSYRGSLRSWWWPRLCRRQGRRGAPPCLDQSNWWSSQRPENTFQLVSAPSMIRRKQLMEIWDQHPTC